MLRGGAIALEQAQTHVRVKCACDRGRDGVACLFAPRREQGWGLRRWAQVIVPCVDKSRHFHIIDHHIIVQFL
jgi:hypothetical protein